MIVSALTGPGPRRRRLVAVDPRGKIADLDEDEGGSLRPAADGTWLIVTRTMIRRRTMARNDEEIPGQVPLWQRVGGGAAQFPCRRQRETIPSPAQADRDRRPTDGGPGAVGSQTAVGHRD